LVRIALNFVSDEWQVFVQSILRKAALPNWDEMWVALKQEELRRDLVKVKLDRSKSSGSKPKEEEDIASLASKGQEEQWRCRKDVSKHDLKAVPVKIEEKELAMTVEIPPGGRWADL